MKATLIRNRSITAKLVASVRLKSLSSYRKRISRALRSSRALTHDNRCSAIDLAKNAAGRGATGPSKEQRVGFGKDEVCSEVTIAGS